MDRGGGIDGDILRLVAEEFERLTRVAEAAERFMRNLAGFYLENGATIDTSSASSVPEVVELRTALKNWQEHDAITP